MVGAGTGRGGTGGDGKGADGETDRDRAVVQEQL